MRTKLLVFSLGLCVLLSCSACSKQQDAAKDAAQSAADAAKSTAAPSASNSAGDSTASKETAPPPVPTVVPAGTTLTIRLGETIDAKTAAPGQAFRGTLARAVSVGGQEVIASGSSATGVVTEAKSAGKLKGEGVLAVRLTSVEIQGRTYRVTTSTVSQVVKGKGKRSLIGGGGGTALGAIIGGIAGGGKGAAIGALAGGGAGTAGAAYTGNKVLAFPAESALSFKLKNAVTLN